ncbi:MAG: tyrosine-type recombinase/integrase [Defluviitaleaceae bacterium]|nr:tyrosine-type recombinase/integrase [Defluviitaleaceae bacterium]
MPQQLKKTKSKAGRRGNNEGSIYQRESDGLWCGTVTTGYNPNGKPMRKTVYGKTRQEAAQKVTMLTAEVFTHGYRTPTVNDSANFQTLLTEWFNLFKAPRLESGTVENRRNLMRNHIFPVFGEMDVKDIDLKRLQGFLNLKANTLAIDTVHKMKQLLSNFFSYAVDEGIISKNPISKVQLKRNIGSDKKGKALRPEVRGIVLSQAVSNPILKPIIITFILTGLRPQELIALRWVNVCLDSKVLSVCEALNRVIEFNADGSVKSRSAKIGKTKTPKSVRSFEMPGNLVSALLEWKQYCEANDIKSEFVFPNTATGAMRTYSGLRSLLERFKSSHGLKDEGISLYTFRHTYATMLIENELNDRLIADLMGHVKTSTLHDNYNTVFKHVRIKAANTIDGIFTSLTENKNPLDLG